MLLLLLHTSTQPRQTNRSFCSALCVFIASVFFRRFLLLHIFLVTKRSVRRAMVPEQSTRNVNSDIPSPTVVVHQQCERRAIAQWKYLGPSRRSNLLLRLADFSERFHSVPGWRAMRVSRATCVYCSSTRPKYLEPSKRSNLPLRLAGLFRIFSVNSTRRVARIVRTTRVGVRYLSRVIKLFRVLLRHLISLSSAASRYSTLRVNRVYAISVYAVSVDTSAMTEQSGSRSQNAGQWCILQFQGMPNHLLHGKFQFLTDLSSLTHLPRTKRYPSRNPGRHS